MIRRIIRHYLHPYHAPLALIGAGLGFYLYLLGKRYHVLSEICWKPQSSNSLQAIVDWIGHVLFSPNLWAFGVWFTLLVVMTLFWLYFFGQFTLPVRTLEERKAIFVRLLYYMAGFHGPALFVQDGTVIASKAERLKNGPGVVVLDLASAAVLRTEGNFTRAVGPGVAFTKSGEYIDTPLDLRTQVTPIGPNPGENPFAPLGEDEPEEAYRLRQERGRSTSAQTRDGQEVAARLVVVFTLSNCPDGLSEEECTRGRFTTPFPGHEEAAWRAVTHRPLDAERLLQAPAYLSPDERLLPWQWLPARLAADLWREYLQNFRLLDLFRPLPDDPQQTALDRIAEAIIQRLTQPSYREMLPGGQWRSKRLPSREYALLQEYGLEVRTVKISEIFLKPAIERTLVEEWHTNWLARAKQEDALIRRKQTQARREGERRAATQWGVFITKACMERQENGALFSGAYYLERLLAALNRMIADDPALEQAQEIEAEALARLWAWAQQQRAQEETKPPGGEA